MTDANYFTRLGERLKARLVERPSGCLEYAGARSSRNYGRISDRRQQGGWSFAHRVAWELANGPIPDGMCICHHCDNPPCCNVDHLFLGTKQDNSRDMQAKGRGVGQIPPGEAHPDARLTDTQVRELRRLAPIVGNYSALARLVGVSQQHVRNIVLGVKRRDAA